MITSDKIIDDLKFHKENLPPGFRDSLKRYNEIFIQRHPWYAIKPLGGKNWRKKPKPLSDPVIVASLYGKYFTGSLGRHYPEFFCIDIDDHPEEYAEELRETLGMTVSDSMLFPSESPNSSHLFGKPTLNGKPPTIKRLHTALKAFAREHRIEIYPQVNRVFRIPFSPLFNSYDPTYYHLNNWYDKLYWFEKLDDYNISRIPGQQLSLDLQYETPCKIIGTLQEGKELLDHGLPCPSSRNESQFKVLYYLWRCGIPQHQAIYITWKWINEKHHGFSKTITPDPEQVKKEIKRQAARIFEDYELSGVYPDDTNNLYNGYLTKPDVPEIFKITQGNSPRAKFLYNLLKYSYPRRHRDFISVHSDLLKQWSSKDSYLKYLDELEIKGILKRGSAYSIDQFSKSIKFNWKYGSEYDSILYDGRSIDTLDDTLRFLYEPPEFREILQSSGCKRTTAIMSSIKVYFKDRLQ